MFAQPASRYTHKLKSATSSSCVCSGSRSLLTTCRCCMGHDHAVAPPQQRRWVLASRPIQGCHEHRAAAAPSAHCGGRRCGCQAAQRVSGNVLFDDRAVVNGNPCTWKASSAIPHDSVVLRRKRATSLLDNACRYTELRVSCPANATSIGEAHTTSPKSTAGMHSHAVQLAGLHNLSK